MVGSIEVTVATTGLSQDTDGYGVRIGTLSDEVASNGTVTFADLAVGTYTVELLDIAENCDPDEDNPQSVDVTADATAGRPPMTTSVTENRKISGQVAREVARLAVAVHLGALNSRETPMTVGAAALAAPARPIMALHLVRVLKRGGQPGIRATLPRFWPAQPTLTMSGISPGVSLVFMGGLTPSSKRGTSSPG